MKSEIVIISSQLEYYFPHFFFFIFWWVRFKTSAGRWKGKVELLFSPKKFCSCQGVFDTSLMAENKDRTHCPGWISESVRTLHGQLLLGELEAKWGKQDHYFAILHGFSERILRWIMYCFCWTSVRPCWFQHKGSDSLSDSHDISYRPLLCDGDITWQSLQPSLPVPVMTHCFCNSV